MEHGAVFRIYENPIVGTVEGGTYADQTEEKEFAHDESEIWCWHVNFRI